MALSTTSGLKAKRQAFSLLNKDVFGMSSILSQALSTLFQELAQKKGNPDLQVVPMQANSTTDAVIADVACKLYGVFLKGGSSAADLRWADHASSANSPTTTIAIGASEDLALIYTTGKAFSNGLTFDESGTNGASGFAIIGAA